jgi:hypothetical protein
MHRQAVFWVAFVLRLARHFMFKNKAKERHPLG